MSSQFYLQLVFSVEYEGIKQRVTSKEITLEHISYPDYWERVGHQVDLLEALFFLYTFTNELYPKVFDFFVSLNDKPLNPEELEEKINSHIRTKTAQEAQG